MIMSIDASWILYTNLYRKSQLMFILVLMIAGFDIHKLQTYYV